MTFSKLHGFSSIPVAKSAPTKFRKKLYLSCKLLETKGVEIKVSSLAEETLLDKVSRWLATSKPLNRVRMQHPA